MRKRLACHTLALFLAATPALAAAPAPGTNPEGAAPVAVDAPDSQALETALQSLPWPRFRRVVEAIPKLKSDVDAYGPLGWEYVKASYTTYPWKKKIDKMDLDSRRRLAALIREVGEGR